MGGAWRLPDHESNAEQRESRECASGIGVVRCCRHTPTACHGHPGQTHRTGLTGAESFNGQSAKAPDYFASDLARNSFGVQLVSRLKNLLKCVAS
jgi:hypothetical protein